jgi:hypothetical protein
VDCHSPGVKTLAAAFRVYALDPYYKGTVVLCHWSTARNRALLSPHSFGCRYGSIRNVPLDNTDVYVMELLFELAQLYLNTAKLTAF